MPSYGEVAATLVGADPQDIADALCAAHNNGLEQAAGRFDEYAREASDRIGASRNVTEIQTHTGTMLRAQFQAKKIRSLRLAGHGAEKVGI